uniref:izumo sperm-egg fusion protein 1-like isoform X3 n=1 Tax=Ictidomys tridecemlineatus TaxID=43179 RepID=UPI001A9FBB36|nr:izumo sperm-egg fusion protein 1-like isoform X3 [Ictidomys tridecemlineatus]
MSSGEWQAEHLRVLGDSERPLLVQELWRARPGWARRFELRGREEARRLEQEAFGAADSDGDQFVKQLYQMLEKEKAKFAQYAAQFQKKDYCPNKCGVMMQRLLWCPDCNLGVYICWKSLDCGQRLVKIHEKENLTLNCLFEWHPLSVGLTDYQFYRVRPFQLL